MCSTIYIHNISCVLHNIIGSTTYTMYSTGYTYTLWATCCGEHFISCGVQLVCCGEQTCYPQYILLMLSTTYHPQHIQRVFYTTYTTRSPQYITCAPQYKILAQKWTPRYSKNRVLYVVGVSIPEHVVENTLYIVGLCCGVHPHVVECMSCGVLHVVDNVHTLWGYVVDNNYSSCMLWVTICCGWHFLGVLHNIYHLFPTTYISSYMLWGYAVECNDFYRCSMRGVRDRNSLDVLWVTFF